MEPFEEPIEDMFAIAKILGRLSIEGHITQDELATMQKQLMKPAPIPTFIGGLHYTPPPVIPGTPFWAGSSSGTAVVDNSKANGLGNYSSYTDNINSTYLVIK